MQHGIVHIRGHDPRIDLEALPLDEQLFDIARNPDAVHTVSSPSRSRFRVVVNSAPPRDCR